jgi:hypothetical protein
MVQDVLAHDLPVLNIHQQAQIGVSSVQLRNQQTTSGGIRYGWHSARQCLGNASSRR